MFYTCVFFSVSHRDACAATRFISTASRLGQTRTCDNPLGSAVRTAARGNPGNRVEAGGKSGLHRAACRLTAGEARREAGFTESAKENIPPVRLAGPVRVKWCGKSAPRPKQFVRQGKPHAEQDQIGEEERPAPSDSRVGR